MRRLARYTGLVGLLGAACVVAAHSGAARAPTLFRVTIVGNVHQEWTYAPAPVRLGDCSRKETSEGIRNASFRTAQPAIVQLSGGRVLPADVGGISGTAILGGANTTEETCGGTGSSKIADCAQTRRSFTRAKVRIWSPRPGILAFAQIRNVRLGATDCPTEPVDVIRRPLGPVPSPLKLPKLALTEARVASMTVRGSRTRRKIYASPAEGRLTERAEWTLKFVRVKD